MLFALTNMFNISASEIAPPPENSIPISNRAELEAINNNLSGTYHLTADIDLSDAEWIPIGNNGSPDFFTGILDGQGHVIRNLRITSGSIDNAGLFYIINGATIKNLKLENTNINSTLADRAGAISGWAAKSKIFNCSNSGTISAYNTRNVADSYAGGIVGYSSSTSI